MNLAQIRTQLLGNTGRTDKSTSELNTIINIAVEEVSTQRLWSQLATTASASTADGVETVSLAADLARLVEVRFIDGTMSRRLDVRPRNWMLKHFPNSGAFSKGKPTRAYLQGSVLYLVPVPDATYTLTYTYFKLHPALSSDADELLIRNTGPAVISYATYWLFQQVEQHENAQIWLQTYYKHLDSAKKIDSSNLATVFQAEPRGLEPGMNQDYWLDPFARHMP